jgi:2-polyprenyl-3-methyl-5-hydroxy-6-metoxy-1,4-benzoquinol methylase|tara:strand:+ start:1510 stop:2571 length:1062 start_codon:yes stop_codon:yes gene_type:complete
MEQLDMQKLEALAGKVVADASASLGILLAYIGDQTGVYLAMADGEKKSVEQIASQANVDARYLQEMLSANAANGYVNYDASSECFYMSPEQIALFASEDSPANMQGLMQIIVAQYSEHEKAVDVFQSGEGRPWEEHHACQFCGADRFFRPGYAMNLVSNWIPALEGVKEKLEAGGVIADIGCGHGSSSVLMAQAFPNSTVFGYDLHSPSIDDARTKASQAGVGNIEFSPAAADDLPSSESYDFACIFDALHDMGDPVGVAKHIRSRLNPGGTLMVVEPMAGDKTEDNLHALGGVFYAASTLICLPTSRSQKVGLCLGAQAGPKRMVEVLEQAGFSSVRVATTSATNIVFEASH